MITSQFHADGRPITVAATENRPKVVRAGVSTFHIDRDEAANWRLPAPCVLLRVATSGQFVTPAELRALAEYLEATYPAPVPLADSDIGNYGGTD